MSDLNSTPTSESSAMGSGSAAETTIPAKPAKSRGLSYYNRFACCAAVLLACATTMILFSTKQSAQSAEDMRNKAQATLQQAGEEFAPYWCAQITPDNVNQFESLHSEFISVDSEVQNIVKQQCAKQVIINDLVANNSPASAFDTEASECIINASSTTMACTVNVTANDNVKKGLAMLSSATVTLKMSMHTTNSWLTSKGYEVGEVATVTVDSNGTGSAQFEIPYDPTWGEYYKISATSFYPNE